MNIRALYLKYKYAKVLKAGRTDINGLHERLQLLVRLPILREYRPRKFEDGIEYSYGGINEYITHIKRIGKLIAKSENLIFGMNSYPVINTSSTLFENGEYLDVPLIITKLEKQVTTTVDAGKDMSNTYLSYFERKTEKVWVDLCIFCDRLFLELYR